MSPMYGEAEAHSGLFECFTGRAERSCLPDPLVSQIRGLVSSLSHNATND